LILAGSWLAAEGRVRGGRAPEPPPGEPITTVPPPAGG